MDVTRRQLFAPWRLADQTPPPPTPIRPPGALPEAAFLKTCDGCSDCVTACPADAIRIDQGKACIVPRVAACALCEDVPCVQACLPKALVVVETINLGTAVLSPDLCWAAMGQPCDYCAITCPVGPAAIRMASDGPVIDSQGCVGCGQCEHICTATPSALVIWADPTRTRT